MDLAHRLRQLNVARPGLVPGLVLLDVASVLTWHAANDFGGDNWSYLLSDLARSSRQIVLVGRGNELQKAFVGPTSLESIESLESAGALAAKAGAGLLIADIERAPHQLWPLAEGVPAIVDIVDGRLWTPSDARAEYGDLSSLMNRELLLNPIGPVLVGEAGRYMDEMRTARSLGREELQQVGVPTRVASRIQEKKRALDRMAAEVRGPADGRARARVETMAAGRGTDSYYMAAEVRGGRLRALVVSTGSLVEIEGEEAVQRELHSMVHYSPDARWFMPQAQTVLGAMSRARIPLPRHVVDPAVGAYVLDPERPPKLEELHPGLHRLSPPVLAQLGDMRRLRPLRGEDLREMVHALEGLDFALREKHTELGLVQLVEDELAGVLQPLGFMESTGLFTSDSQALSLGRQSLVDRHAGDITEATRALGANPADLAEEEQVARAYARFGPLPDGRGRGLRLKPSQLIARYAALGFKEASSILTVMQLAETLKWWTRLERSGGCLRASLTPATTGRWVTNLQSLPVRTAGAMDLRQHLVAPQGMRLLSADWGGFEPRIRAALTGDEFLLRSSQGDPYEHLASNLNVSRAEAKDLLMPLIYGLTAQSYIADCHHLTEQEARALYDAARRRVPDLGRELHGRFDSRRALRTLRGWRRVFYATGRKRLNAGANFLVQGSGADLMRFVLRRLWHELPRYGAALIHQAHDEVVLGVPHAALHEASALVRHVMSVEAPTLLPRPVPMPVRISSGSTWADLK